MVWASKGERLYCRRTDSSDNLAQLLVKVRDRSGLRDVLFPLFSGDADRVPDVFTGDRLLQDAEIVSAVCANITSPPTNKRGQFYIETGFGRTSEEMVPFMAGYVYAGHAVSLGEFAEPTSGKGFVHQVASPNPAAGANFVLTVPANAIWRLISVRVDCAVGVADFSPDFIVLDASANELMRVTAGAVFTAATTESLTLAPGLEHSDVSLVINVPVPDMPLLFEAYTLESRGTTADDDWAVASAWVEEWIGR